MTVDPTPIVRVATGFMAAKQLFAASECGLFAALADGPLALDELAARTGLPERSARILAVGTVKTARFVNRFSLWTSQEKKKKVRFFPLYR